MPVSSCPFYACSNYRHAQFTHWVNIIVRTRLINIHRIVVALHCFYLSLNVTDTHKHTYLLLIIKGEVIYFSIDTRFIFYFFETLKGWAWQIDHRKFCHFFSFWFIYLLFFVSFWLSQSICDVFTHLGDTGLPTKNDLCLFNSVWYLAA